MSPGSALTIAGVADGAAGVSMGLASIGNFGGDFKNFKYYDKLDCGNGSGMGESVADFEKRISKLSPSERVAAVKERAMQVAKENGLIKDSKLSRINQRDIYKNPVTGEYYSLDTQHGRFEYINKKRRHLGEVDFDFNFTKPSDPSGRHNIKVK